MTYKYPSLQYYYDFMFFYKAIEQEPGSASTVMK